jgi:hypothetical protein
MWEGSGCDYLVARRMVFAAGMDRLRHPHFNVSFRLASSRHPVVFPVGDQSER